MIMLNQLLIDDLVKRRDVLQRCPPPGFLYINSYEHGLLFIVCCLKNHPKLFICFIMYKIQNLEMKPEGGGLTVLVGMLLLTRREFELEKSSEADIFDVANTKIIQ